MEGLEWAKMRGQGPALRRARSPRSPGAQARPCQRVCHGGLMAEADTPRSECALPCSHPCSGSSGMSPWARLFPLSPRSPGAGPPPVWAFLKARPPPGTTAHSSFKPQPQVSAPQAEPPAPLDPPPRDPLLSPALTPHSGAGSGCCPLPPLLWNLPWLPATSSEIQTPSLSLQNGRPHHAGPPGPCGPTAGCTHCPAAHKGVFVPALPSTQHTLPHPPPNLSLPTRLLWEALLDAPGWLEAPSGPPQPPMCFPSQLCSHRRPVVLQKGSFLPTPRTGQGPCIYQTPTACLVPLGALPTSLLWSHPFQRGKLRPEGDTAGGGGQHGHGLQLRRSHACSGGSAPA